MKRMKKIASLLLAMVMALALAAPALATAEDGKPDLVKLTQEGGSGHVLEVYQIFTAALSDKGSLDEDTIDWSPSHVDPAKLVAALQAKYPALFADDKLVPDLAAGTTVDYTSQTVAKSVASIIGNNFVTDSDETAELAKTIAKSGALGKPVTVGSQGDIWTGYALVLDRLGHEGPISKYMLKQFLKITDTISPKEGKTTVTKHVWDENKKDPADPTGQTVKADWSDGALYDTEKGYPV